MYEQMNTFTGRQFEPLKMTPADVDITDIAHALSLICRGGGHVRYFFSVGQHSINCANEAAGRHCSRRVILACLLHDASEAYIADIIRPVKRDIPQYFAIEDMIMKNVFASCGLDELTAEESAQVFGIDDDMLVWELNTMFTGYHTAAKPVMACVAQLDEKPWRQVEQQFLKIYEEYKLDSEPGGTK